MWNGSAIARANAAEGKRGEEALQAIGEAYGQLLGDRIRLQAQLQAYAACSDPEVCEVVRAGFGDLVTYVERVSGVGPEEISRFFAAGMLWNVVAAMDLQHSGEEWAARLIAGCGKDS